MKHELKSWPCFFSAIESGKKRHELRRYDDRKFSVGDIIDLQEYDPETKSYSGRRLSVKITYITAVDNPCAFSLEALSAKFCILSIELI